MGAFETELLRRSPLASCVLETGMMPLRLSSPAEGFQLLLFIRAQRFEQFLQLTRDALVRHGGSAHQMFLDLERDDEHPIDESNFYRKLSHMPVELSRGLLRECTDRLRGLLP